MRSLFLVLLLLVSSSSVLGQSEDPSLGLKKSGHKHPLSDFFNSKGAVLALWCMKTELVQKELDLTDAQKDNIVALRKEMQESIAKYFRENPTLSAAEQHKKRDEINGKLAKTLETILKPHQVHRLLEIFTHYGGSVLIFSQTDLATILEMSDDQKLQVEPIIKTAMNKAMQSTSRATDIKTQQKEQFLMQQPIFKKANEEIQKILTPKQLDMLDKMKGKEIDTATLFEEMAEFVELPGS